MSETFKTLSEYAKLCGVTPACITLRAKRGIITLQEVDGRSFVDIAAYPPTGRMKRGKKAVVPAL